MRPRSLLLPTLVLGALHLSCPRPDDPPPLSPDLAALAPTPAPAARVSATPEPAPAPPAPPPLALPTPPPAAPAAAAAEAPATVDPALLTAVPPELIDDGSDALLEIEEPPPPAPTPEVHELASTARETWVFAEPRWSSRKLGYLRAGAVVARRPEPSGSTHCPGGWYRVEPRGYVCVGATATLNIHEPVVEASARRPTLGEGLPYTYVMGRTPPAPLYARLPSQEEQARAEPDLAAHLRRAAGLARSADFVPPPPPEPTPTALLYDRPAPPLGTERRSPDALLLGRAQPRSGFALLSTFEHEGRGFGLTTDLAVIPLDRTRVIGQSAFSGIALEGDLSLPVAFVRRRHAARFLASEGGALARGPALGFREAVPLTGERRPRGGVDYLVARDGSLVRADEVVVVDRPQQMPAWAADGSSGRSGRSGRKWIDVSILRQSLTAYEGTRPVYVTLVSTGADGLGDPKETRSTIQGAFLIHTKHVTVTMDGDEDDEDRFDFRDVPFVQYFTEGYALHAAYWHDDFGTPRSHGCVNLAPIDAAWLFGWTTPEVPAGWHAALSLKKGTLVYIHP